MQSFFFSYTLLKLINVSVFTGNYVHFMSVVNGGTLENLLNIYTFFGFRRVKGISQLLLIFVKPNCYKL